MNIIEGGMNYGWPNVLGAPGFEEYVDPLLEWRPSAPPGGLTFYDGNLFSDMQNDLLFTTLRSEALIRIRFEDPDDPHKPTSIERWFVSDDFGTTSFGDADSRFGRLRAITVGPDGAIYMGTSNRDRGRGNIREGDDRIIRITPASR